MTKTDIIRKQIPVRILKDLGDETMVRFIASTNDIDRDGDIIDQTGWDVSKFLANPVILANHENRVEKIVGRAMSVSINEDRMEMDVKFAKDESDFAGLVYRLVKNGYANAVSVGFIPDMSSIEQKDVEGKKVNVIGKSELLELSVVAVPSNPNALSRAYSKSHITDKDVSVLKNDLDVEVEKEDTKEAEFERKLVAIADAHNSQKMLMKHFAKINKLIGYHPVGDFSEDIPESFKMLQECLTGGYSKSGGGCGCGRSGGCCSKQPKDICHSEIQSGQKVKTHEKPSEEETKQFLAHLLDKV